MDMIVQFDGLKHNYGAYLELKKVPVSYSTESCKERKLDLGELLVK